MDIHLFIESIAWSNDPAWLQAALRSFTTVPSLAPTSAMIEQLEIPFAPDVVATEVFQRRDLPSVSVTLQSRTAVSFLTFARNHTLGLALWGRIRRPAPRTESIAFLLALAEATRADYGFADAEVDGDREPLVDQPFGPRSNPIPHWLNLFGPATQVPDWPGERRPLANGGTLLLTSPEPGHGNAP